MKAFQSNMASVLTERPAGYGLGLRRRRRWFAPEGDSSDGGGDAGADDKGGADGGGATPDGQVTYTQAEFQDKVNQVISERLKRAEGKGAEAALTDLFTKLGVKGVDDLATRLKQAQKVEAESMSEAEKLSKELEKLQALVDEKDQALTAAQEARQKERLQAQVTQAASGALHPDLVWGWLESQDQTMKAITDSIGDDGKAESTLIDAALSKHKEAYPVLWKNSLGNNPGSPRMKEGKAPNSDDEIDAILDKVKLQGL